MNIQLFAINSFTKKIKIFVVCLYLATFASISTYNIYFDIQKEIASLSSLAKAQIDIIIASNENLKHYGSYSKICGKIFNLNIIGSVTILDRNNNLLCHAPLANNTTIESNDSIFQFSDISAISKILVKYNINYGVFVKKFIIVFFINISILVAGILFLNFIFTSLLQRPIYKLQNIIKNIYENDFTASDTEIPCEFLPIVDSLAKSQHSLKKSEKALLEMEKHRVIANLASQVAHDIRSPLAALEMMMKDIQSLPEDKRIIMRSAVCRIQDIANDLLNKNRQMLQTPVTATSNNEKLQTILLSGVLESIISEKRIQCRGRPDLSIELQLGSAAYGIFANIQVREFKRVISNLVINAVEAQAAVRADGESCRHVVAATLKRDGAKGIELTITDNGLRISPEILAQISGPGKVLAKRAVTALAFFTRARRWKAGVASSPSLRRALTRGRRCNCACQSNRPRPIFYPS